VKNKASRKWWISIGATVVSLALAWAVSTALAQAPGGDSLASPAALYSKTWTFTYQGRLLDGGVPANGNYDFAVYLYNHPTTPSLVASCIDVGPGLGNYHVEDGIFTFYLMCNGDNSTVFTGADRWLEVQVAQHGTGITTTLTRQPIAPAPYAFSLFPGAVITGTSLIHSAAETKLAINPFEIEATTELANNTTLSFLHHWLGYTEIENTANTGSSTIFVPAHNFTQLFGSPLKLKDLEVCYKVDTSSSYIDQTRVYYANSSGGRTEIMTDNTNRTSTSWNCYTITNTTPVEIEGPLLVYFNLYFAGTGGSHTVTIGQITATLIE
jgi:hypothetical protein